MDELSLPATTSSAFGDAESEIRPSVDMDLTDQTIVPASPVPEGLLASRISGWRPPLASRLMRPTRKAASKPCQLCESSPEVHSLVWHAYGPQRDTNGALQMARDSELTEISAKQLSQHFSSHNYHQPAPHGRKTAQQMMELASGLSERRQQVLLAAYRQRVLTAKQLSRLFYAEDTSTESSQRKNAYRDLNELRFQHLLFHYRPSRTKQPEVYYFLGRYAAPWVEAHEGRVHGEAYKTDAASISETMLPHDVGAAEMFVAMREQLYASRDAQPILMDGQMIEPSLPVDCWYGARSLQLGYEGGQGQQLKKEPDGFAALTVPYGMGHTRLPFFMEWDRGTREVDDVIEQLLAYVQMQTCGAHAKRFPQLDASQTMPVMMVTSTPTRAKRLADELRARIAAIGIERSKLPLFLFSDQQTIAQAAHKPGAFRSVFDEQTDATKTLADYLLEGNLQLAEMNVLDGRLPVEIDLHAGRPASKGFIAN